MDTNIESDHEWFLDKPHEECGVVGAQIPRSNPGLASMLGEGLLSLQHRGQEAAGIAIMTGGGELQILKDLGSVEKVMGGSRLDTLPAGNIGIGHVRWGTVRNVEQHGNASAGPFNFPSKDGSNVVLAHNGHINNTKEIAANFGIEEDYLTDSELAARAVARVMNKNRDLGDALTEVFAVADGAFSVIAMNQEQLVALRDPHGFRPLMLGTYDGGGIAFASETPALEAMQANYRYEIPRGSVVVTDKGGGLSTFFPFPEKPSSLCAFELIYLSAPHGTLNERSVHMVRKQMGKNLAKEHPANADVVVGVPDSGIPASEGYSEESGIRRVSGLIKNRSRRVFLDPTEAERSLTLKRKISVIQSEIYGKRIVLVDDSIIRGTTMKGIVAMLRSNNVDQVHLRIPCPPYLNPCFFGMNTSEPKELIANQIHNKEELCKYLGVDSIEFLSIGGLRSAAADAAGKLCLACMDGKYPSSVPIDPAKIKYPQETT